MKGDGGCVVSHVVDQRACCEYAADKATQLIVDIDRDE